MQSFALFYCKQRADLLHLIERYKGYLKIYRPIFQVAFPLYNAAFVYCLAILPCPTYSPPPRFLFPS